MHIQNLLTNYENNITTAWLLRFTTQVHYSGSLLRFTTQVHYSGSLLRFTTQVTLLKLQRYRGIFFNRAVSI